MLTFFFSFFFSFCYKRIIAFAQVGDFAEFIVGDKCDALEPVLKLPQMDALLDGNDVCLDVKATMVGALYWLLALSVCVVITTHYIAAKLRNAIHDAMHRGVDSVGIGGQHQR